MFIIHFCSQKLHTTLKHCTLTRMNFFYNKSFRKNQNGTFWWIFAGPIKEKHSCGFEEALWMCFFSFGLIRNEKCSSKLCVDLDGFFSRTDTHSNYLTHTFTSFLSSRSNFLRCPSGTACLAFAKRQQRSLHPVGTIGMLRPACPVAPRVRDRSRRSSSN